MIARCSDDPLIVCGTLRKGSDATRDLLLAVCRLYEAGLPVDFARFSEPGARVVTLPRYPWQRSRHWFAAPRRAEASALTGPVHPLAGQRVRSAVPIFEHELALEDLPLIGDHRVFGRAVFPAAALLEMVRYAGAQALGIPGVLVRDLAIEQPLVVPETGSRRIQAAVVGADTPDPEVGSSA